jgi:hypothetical protein
MSDDRGRQLHLSHLIPFAVFLAALSGPPVATAQPRLTTEDVNIIQRTGARARRLHREMQQRYTVHLRRSRGANLLKIPDTLVPEDGDVQQLPAATTAGFGPLAQIWADIGCSTCTSPTGFNTSDGQLTADIVLGSGAIPQTYRNLGLTSATPLYCVRVRSADAAGTNWRGYVLTAPPGQPCAARQALSGAGLKVVYDPSGSNNPAHYPRAARWGEGIDAGGKRHPTIEVPCGAGWCSLMPDAVSPEENIFDPQDQPQEKQKTHIKGWHDHQLVLLQTGSTVTRTYSATIVPRHLVSSLGDGANYEHGGHWVATVYFAQVPQQGSKYWNAGFRQQENKLILEHFPPSASFPRAHWEARVQGSTIRIAADSVWHGSQLSGTARWSWRTDDEDIWIRCAESCCYVDLTALL